MDSESAEKISAVSDLVKETDDRNLVHYESPFPGSLISTFLVPGDLISTLSDTQIWA